MGLINLIGETFGRWNVIGMAEEDKEGRRKWQCRCVCGVEKSVHERSLREGKSRSCGCIRHDKAIDLTGQKFGRWTALKRSHVKDGQTLWLCRCECGKEQSVYLFSLRDGTSKSCGCLKNEVASEFHTRHGSHKTKEYRAWSQAKSRCKNVKNKAYPNYGGRGIRMCERWLECFENFFEDMGLAPSKKHSLDRFPNNKDGHYESGNCRWATKKEQQNNRRNNHYIYYNGENKTLTEWAEFLGEKPNYFSKMIVIKKMSIEQIVNRKKRRKSVSTSECP